MINVLHLGLSYACNMHCKHCFVSKKKDKISTNDIKKLIDKLYEYGLVMVYYTYGEPLLARNFSEVCQYVKHKGLVQILMTNGSLFSQEVLCDIKENNISNIFISIDDINYKEHDLNRGVNGAYEKALSAIRMCKKAGLKVGISTTITSKNVNYFDKIYALALDEEVNIISFLRERKHGQLLPLTKEQITNYQNILYRCMTSGNSIGLNFHDPSLRPWLKDLYDGGHIDRNTYNKYDVMCSCHKETTISVAPDGSISACNLAQRIMGNILVDDIEEIIKKYETEKDYICSSSISQ